MAVAVIDKIVRKCHEIERIYNQGHCSEKEQRSLVSCLRNLRRIEPSLTADTFEDLWQSLHDLGTVLSGVTHAGNGGFSVPRIHSGEFTLLCK